MTTQVTFYYSRIIGSRVFDEHDALVGYVTDLVVESNPIRIDENEALRPKVVGIRTKLSGKTRCISFSKILVIKERRRITVKCSVVSDLSDDQINSNLLLNDSILDKQIVDMNGRKLVRANDIRLVSIPSGIYAIAVDVGIEGLLRRIGIARPIKMLLFLFKMTIPAKFILWDDVAAIDAATLNIKLTKTSSKLHTLHPSDLADIIEELGKTEGTSVFSSLDEEKAADVLEEMEPHAQIHILESISLEKAADVLEKMPADEVADILDVLEDEKAEMLLNEMEKESSEEVRELLEYSRREVGSIMSTDYLSFQENMTVEETLHQLRLHKPEQDALYHLFVTDNSEKLLATLSLRDLIISEPDVQLNTIMKTDAISVFDDDDLDSLAEIISKYNLLAIPVTDKDMKMQGMVVIDDIVEDLLDKRKTK